MKGTPFSASCLQRGLSFSTVWPDVRRPPDTTAGGADISCVESNTVSVESQGEKQAVIVRAKERNGILPWRVPPEEDDPSPAEGQRTAERFLAQVRRDACYNGVRPRHFGEHMLLEARPWTRPFFRVLPDPTAVW